MRMDIKGACVVAARNPPMPTRAYALPLEMTVGSRACSAPPATAPMAAPTNRVGVKTPPTAPEPTVAAVLNTLAMSTRASNCPARSPRNISPTVL